MHFSAAYVEHLTRGPFPDRIDPWAEPAHYFQQIHAGMIDSLLHQLNPGLRSRGYVAGREASLQILEGREPDIFVQQASGRRSLPATWDYSLAAEEALAEPGVVLSGEITMQAIHIRTLESGDLVTVVEVISPGNKTVDHLIQAYRQRRETLVVERGVNVVEIDLTRSVKRLIQHTTAREHPFHAVVFLPGDAPHFIGIAFAQTLPRVAFPLRGEVIAGELQSAYDDAYQNANIAAQLLKTGYEEAHLPFPSLLSEPQRRAALAAVDTWREALAHLRDKED